MSNLSIGLQLYTVRDQTAQDFKETIRRVAEMGYTGVEFAGYGNLTASEMRALLKETGLHVAGAHAGLQVVDTNLEHTINYCLEIGCPCLVVPWLAPDWYTADRFRILALHMNEIGRRCQERGITLAFHNHATEFVQATDRQYLLDILLDASDPAFVKLELDTYWAAYAGVNPIAYLRARTGRVPLVHLKDMTPERTFTEVGDGMLDIQGIINAAQQAGTQWYVVENDEPVLPSLESARRSHENLRTLLALPHHH